MRPSVVLALAVLAIAGDGCARRRSVVIRDPSRTTTVVVGGVEHSVRVRERTDRSPFSPGLILEYDLPGDATASDRVALQRTAEELMRWARHDAEANGDRFIYVAARQYAVGPTPIIWSHVWYRDGRTGGWRLFSYATPVRERGPATRASRT